MIEQRLYIGVVIERESTAMSASDSRIHTMDVRIIIIPITPLDMLSIDRLKMPTIEKSVPSIPD